MKPPQAGPKTQPQKKAESSSSDSSSSDEGAPKKQPPKPATPKSGICYCVSWIKGKIKKAREVLGTVPTCICVHTYVVTQQSESLLLLPFAFQSSLFWHRDVELNANKTSGPEHCSVWITVYVLLLPLSSSWKARKIFTKSLVLELPMS